MNFNKHYEIGDQHAFLSPSKYHWINYDSDKLRDAYLSHLAVKRGTELHQLAYDCARLGIKLPKNKDTLNTYVNDVLGYRMTPEQPLVYSKNCFGKADAISFRNGLLRIHDLKTGITPAHIEQLEIYAALFCLEYGVNPEDIDTELRLYQNNEVLVENPSSDHISDYMERIVAADNQIESLKEESK